MGSVVSRVARQWIRHSWVRVPLRARDFFTQKRPDRLWSPPSLLYNRYEVKRPYREASHTHPSGAEVKNEWIYALSPVSRCGMVRV